MKHWHPAFWGLAVSILALSVAACQPVPAPPPTSSPQVVTAVVTVVVTALPPTPALTPVATATGAPSCTVVQKVNFRSGPGTAYIPPLRSFDPGAVLAPRGYNPKGVPAGAWVQVLDSQSNQLGWTDADPQFVKCNIDLKQLPSVAVQAPLPPPVPRVSNSQPDGNPRDLVGELVYSPDFLVQMRVHTQDSQTDGAGIDWVKFRISKNNQMLYERIEKTPSYCIFGGDAPDCNPWPQTNGKLSWGEGGSLVEDGIYDVDILVLPKSANGNQNQVANWSYKLTLKLP